MLQMSAIPPTPPLSVADLAALPGAWIRAPDGRFASIVPRRFGLHPIEETDPRFRALARHERVEVAPVAPFILWGPQYLPSHSIHHRGLVARTLNGADAPYADLWIDGTAYAFLRDSPALAVHACPPAWCEGHCWFTYEGAELYGLVQLWAALPGGRLMLDIERVAV